MSNYSVQAFMDSLPSVLLEDAHMKQLAEVAARVFMKVYGNRWKAAIYSKIDDLDEAVLDILAKDLKIDWYDYGATLKVKRRTVKDSWYVHRRMGTARAVEKALSDIWPNSTVEEWFTYDGSPFHFRVIQDASEPDQPIHVNEIMKAIRLYKPVRAVLDDAEPIIRVTCNIVIETQTDHAHYHPPLTGTLPRVATRDYSDGLLVGSDSSGSHYHPVLCGTPNGALM